MRKKKTSQEGAAVVEFAIVLPLLLLLLFGMIEFGLLMYNKQVITNASREGARWAIVQPNSSDPLDLHSPYSVKDRIDKYVDDRLVSFSANNSVTPNLKNLTTNNTLDINNSTSNVCSSFGDDIQVKVTYNYDFLVFDNILKLFNGNQGSIAIAGETIMRCESSIP